MQAADSDKKPQDEPPPPLTAAQKARIKHSPVHVRLRHTTYGSLAIGVISPLTNVAALIFAAVWAKYILQQDRWCGVRPDLLHFCVLTRERSQVHLPLRTCLFLEPLVDGLHRSAFLSRQIRRVSLLPPMILHLPSYAPLLIGRSCSQIPGPDQD